MSSELQPHDTPPTPQPPMDEGYWSSLLSDSRAIPISPDVEEKEDDIWQALSTDMKPLHINGSYNGFGLQEDWEEAASYSENDRTIELEVAGFNRGGLLVTWNSLRGFVPASQLVDFPVDTDEEIRNESLAERVDKQLVLRIIEIDMLRNRLILSERAAQVESGRRVTIFDELVKGQNCEGMVTNLCDFGAFVDLGGVEGLIHISELSWGRISHPRDVLSSGDKVKVHIMGVDSDQGRVALSLKRLLDDPWQTVEERYSVGQYVEGIITNVVDFGAFACIEEGLEGLIHVSELAEGQFLHPRNVIDEGESVKARILNIDGQARRLGLSLRSLDSDENVM